MLGTTQENISADARNELQQLQKHDISLTHGFVGKKVRSG